MTCQWCFTSEVCGAPVSTFPLFSPSLDIFSTPPPIFPTSKSPRFPISLHLPPFSPSFPHFSCFPIFPRERFREAYCWLCWEFLGLARASRRRQPFVKSTEHTQTHIDTSSFCLVQGPPYTGGALLFSESGCLLQPDPLPPVGGRSMLGWLVGGTRIFFFLFSPASLVVGACLFHVTAPRPSPPPCGKVKACHTCTRVLGQRPHNRYQGRFSPRQGARSKEPSWLPCSQTHHDG